MLIKLNGFDVEGGCYVKEGVLISNFVVCVHRILILDLMSPEFCLEVRGRENTFSLRLTLNEIMSKRFLRNVPVFIDNEAAFYQEFRRSLLKTDFGEEDTSYQTNNNGLQEVKGHLSYVFSNGSIVRNGFSSQIYSGRDGVFVPPEAVNNLDLDVEGTRCATKRLFEIFDCEPNIFYPLFFLNISAICNGYFQRLGEREFMRFTIWIDGSSGSGKTELAKAAGTFTFADEFLNPNLINATSRAKYVLERLRSSSGSVCILDDVKDERVRDRRNSVATIVDDVLRSIYQGMLTDGSGQLINACALITGEYMDTQESQNARIFYLKADQFLKRDKNSTALRKLQKNPLLLTTVCCSFIQWLLGKVEETSFPKLLLQKIEVMRSQEKEYKGIGNAERLNENIYMLRMAQEMTALFFVDIGLSEVFLVNFNRCAVDSIRTLGDNTYILLGGESMALLKVTENILRKCKLRKAQFIENREGDDLCKYYQAEFMIQEEDDFVYIDDIEKSLQLSTDDGHAQYVTYPYLIGKAKHILSLFADEIENMQQTGQISPMIAERLFGNLPQKLKKAQIIFKKRRSDNPWGRTAAEYPICNCESFKSIRHDNMGKPMKIGFNGVVDCESAIQMNTTHSCMSVLKERLEQGDFSIGIPSFLNLRYENTEEMKVYKTRRAFTVGKSLYRE